MTSVKPVLCRPCLQANSLFGQVVLSAYKPGDMVWVQDYHLMLLPSILKQTVPRMKVCWGRGGCTVHSVTVTVCVPCFQMCASHKCVLVPEKLLHTSREAAVKHMNYIKQFA
jgi:hypothetical protein